MRVVPKVWTRLIITFLLIFVIYFVYTSIFVGLLLLCLVFVAHLVGIILAVIPIVASIVGIVYLTVVSALACVVSVLEDVYGRKAMSKSKALLKGKLWSVVGCFVLLILSYVLVEYVIYFACKSYHQENLVMSYLADRLKVNCKSNDIQLRAIPSLAAC
ncbi:uncharacterized protein LOC116190139 [Punica granatum]|nr:uncharacterized protein LOC116188740 [Punica granatum]XP_031375658.1 uncharacterized protein LOC116190139 [Punica granatum]OWM90750.1 hypothetical protein CDL15_Pgr020713 [Punica granatum]